MKYLAHETSGHARCTHTIYGYERFTICLSFYQKPVRICHHHNIQLKSYCVYIKCTDEYKKPSIVGTKMIKANNMKDFNRQKTTNLKNQMLGLFWCLLHKKFILF